MSRTFLKACTAAAALGLMALSWSSCSDRPNEPTGPVVAPPNFAITGYGTAAGYNFMVGEAQWTSGFDVSTSVGTGVIRPFLDMQKNPSEQGFNTDNNDFVYDQHRTSDTNALPLNYVPIISVQFGNPPAGPFHPVREFVLDAHESDNFFDIDEFQVYLCFSDDARTYSTLAQVTAACTPVYTIAGSSPPINATDQFSSGSGNVFDYRILVPETLFQGALVGQPPGTTLCEYNPSAIAEAACHQYIIVWSKMSNTGSTFEEYSTILRPAVKIVKTPDASTVDAGNDITFTMVVTSSGSGTATAVTVSDPLPAGTGVNWYAATPGTCSISGSPPTQTLNCTLGDVAAGSSITITATAHTTQQSCAVYDNTATVTSTNAGSDDDPGQITVANCKGTKSGTKFQDNNANGTMDAGEPGLSSWTIAAYTDADLDGVLSAAEYATTPVTATTNASGAYTMTLLAGKYVVCEVKQATWMQSAPSNTKCQAGSATLADGGFAVTITGGSSETGNNFGNFQGGTKSGTKFQDSNANGVKDALEPGLAGWTIAAYADGDGDGVLSAAEYATTAVTTTTNATGAYTLSLNPGKYLVCEVKQATWTQSLPGNTKCQAGSATLADGGYAITITSGSSETTNDFGNWQQGTKSGTKFQDSNANGTKDAGEPGLSGWTIAAYADANGDGVLQAGEYVTPVTTTTNGSGAYTLSLNPGKYVVCEVAQATWTQSAPGNTKCEAGAATLANGGFAVTITSGSSETNNDFGNWQQGTKSGTKFQDDNANGVKDAGEPGLSGWTIAAYADANLDGVLSAAEYATTPVTTTTDASGAYTLSLNPGKYVVCEVAQATWTQSLPANTKCQAGSATLANGGFAVTITSGSSELNNNFGNWQQGTKSGTKFQDDNANGVKDAGEPGLSGWTIAAYVDGNGDGVLQAGEYVTPVTTTTDASGAYTLSLNPGKYVVCEVAQSTWTQSAPVNTKCQAGSATLGNGGFAVTITSGSSEPNNDFGNFQGGTKSGTKFQDSNANGVKDPGEPGLSGWTIAAYADANGDGVLSAAEYATTPVTTTTNGSGAYTLSLNPGKFVVCEVAQATWTQSLPVNTKCQAGSATLADGGFAVTITSGSSEPNNDFGNWQQGTKSGTKFQDDNANGVKDAGEPGLSGWTIAAYPDDGDGVLSAAEYAGTPVTTTTNGSGAYSLSLNPGKYVVCEVAQATWTQSAPGNTKCQAGAATLANGGFAVTITSGSSEPNNNFGNWQQGTKSGTKFQDTNANGTKDALEPGLSGWTIAAYPDDGDGVLSAAEYAATPVTTTTNASGAYTLTLNPGKYVVCEVAQATWTESLPANTKCQAGAATLANGGFAVTITSGSSETNNDFGNWQQGTKSGTKFQDSNANGVKDALEPGLSGWTIAAYPDDGDGVLSAAEYATTPVTTTTNASGAYTLSLNPGKYVVCEVAQATWTQSLPSNTKCQAGAATLANGGFAVTITSGSSETNNDFGNWQQGTKSGYKYNDASMNGTRDGGESGLAGWTIRAYADANADGALSAAEYATTPVTATTDATGAYTLSLDPGKYVVCEVAQSPWMQSEPVNTKCQAGSPTLASGGYAVTITSGSSEPNNNFGNFTGTNQLTPTQTTCADFVAGTSADLTTVEAGVKNGKISQTNPGVFFYYTEVTLGASGTADVSIVETVNPSFALFKVHQGQAYVYTSACGSPIQTMTVPGNGASPVTTTITGTPGATFVIGIKYNTSDGIVGLTAGAFPKTYTFTTWVNGVAGLHDSLDLVKK